MDQGFINPGVKGYHDNYNTFRSNQCFQFEMIGNPNYFTNYCFLSNSFSKAKETDPALLIMKIVSKCSAIHYYSMCNPPYITIYVAPSSVC